jgi:hypothetical protein
MSSKFAVQVTPPRLQNDTEARIAQNLLQSSFSCSVKPSHTMTSRYFNVMSPRNDVYQAIPLNLSYGANEPLITAAGDAGAEEEDHRLEKKLFARLKFSALLLRLLLGCFVQLMIIETKMLLFTFWDEHPQHHATKSQTNIIVVASLRFLRKLVTSTYSAAGGCSKDLLENIVLHVEYCFGVGTFLAWTIGSIAGAIWGMPTKCALLMLAVVLLGYKIEMMCSATDSNPPFLIMASPPSIK